MTHKCTSCGLDIVFESKGGWLNARTKLNRTGMLRCRTCGGKEGRAASEKQPTGRPKGSKNSVGVIAWNKGLSEQGKRLNSSLTFEQRMQGIAKRNGYNSYEEYRASLDDWKKYKVDVWRVTKQQPLHLLENYDKRGVNGEEGAYTLDHILSIRKGFNESIPAEKIGDISNLQMLPWEENITKGWK